MSFYLKTVGPPPVASGTTAGVHLFESDDIISCVTQLPRLSALLPENSVLSVLLERDVSDLVCFVLKGTAMVPVYHRRGVCFFVLRS